jgi:AraC-like DNA-binding protein
LDRPVDFSYKDAHPYISQFHSHPKYEIYYFHEGKCNYVIGSKMYVLQPGDLILMHGMTLHCPNPDPRWPYIRSLIHFDAGFVKEYMNRAYSAQLLKPFEELRNHRLRLEGSVREEVESLLADMNRCFRMGGVFSYERFLLRFMDLLYIVSDRCRQPLLEASMPQNDKERHVRNAIRYMEEHYGEELTMDDLERELHVSKHYLAKVFKELTGHTVFNYLYNRRINEAKVLLMLEHGMSVSEVCYRVGFKHLPHFSRVFKRTVGCPPEEYRKQVAR